MLYKNVWKLFKKKKLQLIGVGLIIFVSSFLFVSIYNSMNTLDKVLKKYFNDYNQEDFSVCLNDFLSEDEYSSDHGVMKLSDLKKIDYDYYMEIINNRIEEFKSYYNDVELEIREGKDVSIEYEDKPIKCRVIKDSNNINLSLIEKGRKPKSKNEIAVPKIFADTNSIKIGDNISINDESYEIVGYFIVPDYTLIMFGNEMIIGNDRVTIALLSDEGYENISGSESFKLSGKYTKKVSDSYFDNCSLSYVTNIVNTDENMLSGYISTEVEMGTYLTICLSLFIVSIAIIIVSIILYKFIQMEKNQIGVLKSLGYLDKEITRPYLVLIVALALPMLVLGAIVGQFCATPLINLFRVFYLFPTTISEESYLVYVIAILLPLIVFISFSYIIVRLFLKKKPLELLKIGETTKIDRLTKCVDKILRKAKATTKFKYSFLLRNKGKLLVFLLGFAFSTFLIIISLITPDAFLKMSTEAYEIVDYKYEAYVDITKELPLVKSNEERNITIETKYKGDLITLKGLETDNKLYNIFSNNNENITEKLEKGIVISKTFSVLYNKDKGDNINIEINGVDKKLKVREVSKDYGNATVYFNIEALSELYFGEGNKDFFTGIYSDDEINKYDYSYVICKADVIEQASSLNKLIFITISLMIVVSVILTAIILFVLTSLTIEDNFYNISLLKVMGYKKKEVNSMILNSYLVYGIITYIISVPLAIISMKIFFRTLSDKFRIVMPFELKLWQAIVGFIVIILCYYLGTLSAKKKINELSLQEVLKEYRE